MLTAKICCVYSVGASSREMLRAVVRLVHTSGQESGVLADASVVDKYAGIAMLVADLGCDVLDL